MASVASRVWFQAAVLFFNNSEEVKCIGLMRVDAWVVIA
jgi:hypothetical protein